MTPLKLVLVCGARPNFMKIAPLVRALRAYPLDALLVHTGQHYDERMSHLFFRQLDIPAPDVNLEVGSGSHAVQTAEIMRRFEPILQTHSPDCVVVVGDVNSTIACALVAAKLGVRVAHVEAGLRSFDRSMPEEINRLLTDAISDLLFVSEPSGLENLRKEGVPPDRVHFVGNVMIDTLKSSIRAAESCTILDDMRLARGQFALVTLHRPSNVDDITTFSRIVDALDEIQQDVPVLFPMHPRTRTNLSRNGLAARLSGMSRLQVVDPLGYLEFLTLMANAAAVLTDSGGIQEETTILNVPCLTLRENTERPVTITHGTNVLVGTDARRIVAEYRRCRSRPREPLAPPEKWDGRAAERIAAVLTSAI